MDNMATNDDKTYTVDLHSIIPIMKKIIILICLFIIFAILLLLSNQNDKYSYYKKILESRATTYTWLENVEIDNKSSKIITLKDLEDSYLLYNDIDLKKECNDAYVVIKNDDYKYKYKVYVSCDNYISKNYGKKE